MPVHRSRPRMFRRHLRTRSVALLIAVLALVGLAAGCGQSDVLDAGAATGARAVAAPVLVQQAADRTVAVESGKVHLEVDAQGGTVTVDGQFDTNRHVASANVSATGFADVGDLTADVVYDQGSLYVRPDGFASLLGQALGTPWVRIDLSNLDAMLPEGVQLQGLDPSALIDKLTAEGIQVTEAGTEDVRGTSTTHYVVTIPEGALVDNNPPAQVDVWIDGDGLVRRVEGATTGDPQVTVRAELFDLGSPVSIDVPAPSDVTDLGNLSGLFGNRPR